MEFPTDCDDPIFSSMANDSVIADIIEMFVAEVPERLATLEKAWNDRDLEAVRRILHQMRGAAGSFGDH